MKKKAKKLVIYGDSISTTSHGEGGYEAAILASFHLESIANYAVGSSGLATATPNNAAAIIADAANIPADADIILIWHGSNDWYWGTPIGTVADQTAATFWGAINCTVKQLQTVVPAALLVWLTPLYRFENPCEGTGAGSAYQTKNRVGHTLYDYYQVVEQAGKYHGFSVIDMQSLTGIHQGNQDYFLEDFVHPNKLGYQRIHSVLDSVLKRLLEQAEFEIEG